MLSSGDTRRKHVRREEETTQTASQGPKVMVKGNDGKAQTAVMLA